jgi:CRISPR/Cas system-associated exonuclease Cas4 (RecB family)
LKSYRLSKSKYLSGLQCDKRLWLEIHSPELIPPTPPTQERIFNQGTYVGELARERFPGGILIDADYENISEAFDLTKEALSNDQSIIFEGIFSSDNVLVRPDVIKQDENNDWELIEVKSSTSVKDENIHDVAVQTYVLKGAGIDVKKTYLMYINTECVYPDLSNLFAIEEITEQVNEVLPTVPGKLDELRKMLALVDHPDIQIGQHCFSPYGCPFVDHCWSWIPENSIFTIPRLRWSFKQQLLEENQVEIGELPVDFPLNDKQQRYKESVQKRKAIIDWEAIKDEMSKLKYPLYFLDFETDNPAIPRFDGMHPYEQFPFQYSCHIIGRDGNVIHKEYLHESKRDPRKLLAEALVRAIGKKGTVIAYNAPFERGVLNRLARWFPEHGVALESIADRLWDQLIIFRNHYTDYRFGGSNSLKNVLPVMVPSMSYENLGVSDGGEAQVTWNEMIRFPEGDDKNQLVADLKEYCGQDTWAMVEIHNKLVKSKER